MTDAGGSENSEALEALGSAIYTEQCARNFYETVAKTVISPQTKSRFNDLARDEARHREILESRYQAIAGKAFEFDESKVPAVRVQISDQSSAIHALDIAIAAERRAYQRYKKAAEAAASRELKEMYIQLAEEEDGHYQSLQAERQAETRGDYWFTSDAPGMMDG